MTADRYSSFADLKHDKREGVDFCISSEDRGSHVLVMAPHGGLIEPHTTELAEAIAGEDFSFYSFIGRQRAHNRRDLHITSRSFDESLARGMAAEAELVFAVHGHQCKYAEFVMPGGRHAGLRNRLTESLRVSGFDVKEPEPGLTGRNKKNICNHGRLGKGLQVEVSKALRARLRDEEKYRSLFVNAIRLILLEYEESHGK